MTTKPSPSSRRIAACVLAVLLTVGVHGGWLHGLDHDAAAVIARAA